VLFASHTDRSSNIFKQAIEWGKQLLNMTGDGYAHTCPITPYIHLMIYHVPVMLQKYETMKIFTGQGKIYHSKKGSLST